MSRKPRIDSTAEIVRVMTAAAKAIVPPATVPLTQEEMPFFEHVVAEFSHSELSAHKLEMIAILARIMADLVCEQRKKDSKRTTIIHLADLVVSLRRSLSIHARALGPRERPTKVAKDREKLKAIERNSPLVEDLIARPN